MEKVKISRAGIEDLEEARKLLGYGKINFLSASYGTRVALLYAYRRAAVKGDYSGIAKVFYPVVFIMSLFR